MKDYTERIAEFCEFVEIAYGLGKRQSEMLLSSLLPCSNGDPCWLILDTMSHQLWHHFREFMKRKSWGSIVNLWGIKSLRPRDGNKIVSTHLANRNSLLWIKESSYAASEAHKWHHRSMWPILEAECLRLQVKLSFAPTNRGAESELTRLLNLVLDVEHRPFLPSGANVEGRVAECMALVMRCNGKLNNLPATAGNVGMLLASRAVLFGRDHVDDSDRECVMNTLVDTIGYVPLTVLRAFADNPGALDLSTLEIETGIKRAVVQDECVRLSAAGVLQWNTQRGRKPKWITLSPVGMDVAMLLSGGK